MGSETERRLEAGVVAASESAPSVLPRAAAELDSDLARIRPGSSAPKAREGSVALSETRSKRAGLRLLLLCRATGSDACGPRSEAVAAASSAQGLCRGSVRAVSPPDDGSECAVRRSGMEQPDGCHACGATRAGAVEASGCWPPLSARGGCACSRPGVKGGRPVRARAGDGCEACRPVAACAARAEAPCAGCEADRHSRRCATASTLFGRSGTLGKAERRRGGGARCMSTPELGSDQRFRISGRSSFLFGPPSLGFEKGSVDG